jgi:VIT1/CCC1 family predicted Fe2+/Mn2+ transporter
VLTACVCFRHSHECGHEHMSQRGGWLRAGVMGATDGLVSTAGLMMGIAGSVTDQKTVVMSGVAGELPAGKLRHISYYERLCRGG